MVFLTVCSSASESAELTVDDLVEAPPEETFRDRVETIEESKQTCMTDQGFEYVTHVQPRPTVNSAKALIRGALIVSEDREVVEQHGYGLAAGIIESNEFFDSDPNRELRATLSQQESLEYVEVEAACTFEAQEAAGIGERYLDLSMQVTMLISELETEIITDARLAESTEFWAGCMNEKGHAFRTLSDPRDEIASRLNAFLPDGSLDEEAERAERDVFYASLLEEEVELAVDDLDCREESGVAEVLPEIMEEAEAGFLDRHGDLLAEVYAIRTGS